MAIKNNSVEIIIDAVTKKPSSESGEKSAAVILSGDTLKDIAEKTDADIVIQTNVAKIRLNADGTYTFITGYFSQYALMAAKDANTAIQAQKAEVKALKLTLLSRQVQTLSGKKAVKLTWTGAKKH